MCSVENTGRFYVMSLMAEKTRHKFLLNETGSNDDVKISIPVCEPILLGCGIQNALINRTFLQQLLLELGVSDDATSR
jgi:hypothetical protein